MIELKQKLNRKLTTLEVGGLTIYFSYQTVIAFKVFGNLYISENKWGSTTGKHLNSINSDKNIRISHSELMQKLNNLITEVGLNQE